MPKGSKTPFILDKSQIDLSRQIYTGQQAGGLDAEGRELPPQRLRQVDERGLGGPVRALLKGYFPFERAIR